MIDPIVEIAKVKASQDDLKERIDRLDKAMEDENFKIYTDEIRTRLSILLQKACTLEPENERDSDLALCQLRTYFEILDLVPGMKMQFYSEVLELEKQVRSLSARKVSHGMNQIFGGKDGR